MRALPNEYAVPRFAGRARTIDNALTFDGAVSQNAWRVHDSSGTAYVPGHSLGGTYSRRVKIRDANGAWQTRVMTFDSTGAFLVGELERLDQTFHMPLVAVSWQRDIKLRQDVTLADEISSFTLSTFGTPGNLGTGSGIGNGKHWSGKNSTEIAGVSLDIAKKTFPLTPWDMELQYTIFELESAAKTGRPVDRQKFDFIKLQHQMEIDEQVYYGDTTLGVGGLVKCETATSYSNAFVSNYSNAPNGAQGSSQWANKTADEILTDFNTLISSTWQAAAWAVIPRNIRIPPAQFGYLSTAKVSQAGNMSILKYVMENNVLTAAGEGNLDIKPLKWCIGAGVGGTIGTTGTVDRMVAYTNEQEYVRFPMTLMANTPIQYQGIYHKRTYYCKLGVIEMPYPETVGYMDGI
jgi:hypothetical protein